MFHKTPYEVIFGHEPTYDHLRVFDYLCYASTLSHTRSKFDPRAKKCVFLGYPFGVKGYKVYDLSSKSVFISRDVIFHENIFPFIGTHATLVDPFLSDFAFQGVDSSSTDTNSFVTPVFILDSLSNCSGSSVSPSAPNSVDHSIETSNTLLADAPTTDCLPSQISLVPLAALPNQTCASTPEVPPAPIKKLARTSKPPAYLQDYSCASACSPTFGGPYDICHSLNYAHLVPNYQSYVLAVSSTPQEPQSFFQAVKDPLWREAMDKEIQALEQNHT